MNFIIIILLYLIPTLSIGDESYIGIGIKNHHMNFKEGFGEELFRTNSFGPNLFGGIKFNDHVGIEGGYEILYTKSLISTYYNQTNIGDINKTPGNGASTSATPTGAPCAQSLGVPVIECISPLTCLGRGKIKGPYLNLLGFYSPISYGKVEFMGGFGVSFVKASYGRYTLQSAGYPMDSVRILEGRKALLRLMGGFQYKITDNLKFRGDIGWLNTKRLNIMGADNNPSPFIPRAIPTNTAFYELGILYQFD